MFSERPSAVSDLDVTLKSAALSGVHFDLIISGSIAAVESVRFIRSLRRLGTQITPWLSAGAEQFVGQTAVAWAAATAVRSGFAGEKSHLCQNDALIVAPATANIIGKIAGGISDTAEAALALSYLGSGKPVYILPTMHDSLRFAPPVAANINKVSEWATLLAARIEEGKQKFPEPELLANEIAHLFNAARLGPLSRKILLTMGTTRGYVDPVRYFSNYSSGGLGTLTAEEIYRRGHQTFITCGPCDQKPRSYTKLDLVETNEQMLASAKGFASSQHVDGAILAASVLDYAPSSLANQKIRSGTEGLKIDLKPCAKIIAQIKPQGPMKVGFKLETELDETKARSIATDYMQRYDLSMVVLNQLQDVGPTKHKAFVISRKESDLRVSELASKQAIANHLASQIH